MRVALITGGYSAEREIALMSSQFVQKALQDKVELFVYDFPTDIERFVADRTKIDVVVPVMHGRGGGEDGELQGFLKTLSVPFVFSGIHAHAVGMDKAAAKTIVAAAGVNVPRSVVIGTDQVMNYTHPVVVKPVDAGSSKGVVIVKSEGELDAAIREASSFSGQVMVEDYVEGREFTVGVMEEKGKVFALPVTEIVVEDGFFDFDRKYDADQLAQEICPADISAELQGELEEAAVRAHQAIGARHLSRSDFMVSKDGEVFFLEINTIPGMTPTSFIPNMLQVAGRDFGDVLLEWMQEVA